MSYLDSETESLCHFVEGSFYYLLICSSVSFLRCCQLSYMYHMHNAIRTIALLV